MFNGGYTVSELIQKKGNFFEPLVQWKAMLPFVVGLDVAVQPFVIPAAGTPKGAGFQSPRSAFEGGFEGNYFMFEDSTDTTATANWTVQFTDYAGRDLMNFPVHVRTLFGTAQNPAYVREPLTLFSREKLGITFAKISGGAVSVRLNCGGIQYNPTDLKEQAMVKARINKWMSRRQSVFPYWITPAAPVQLAGNAAASFDVKISDTIQAFSLASVSTGEFTIQITEVRSGQVICNGVWSNVNGMGDATFPWVFDRPLMIKEGSRLRFTITDVSGVANTIWITIAGRKIVCPVKDLEKFDRDFSDLVPLSDSYTGIEYEPVGDE